MVLSTSLSGTNLSPFSVLLLYLVSSTSSFPFPLSLLHYLALQFAYKCEALFPFISKLRCPKKGMPFYFACLVLDLGLPLVRSVYFITYFSLVHKDFTHAHSHSCVCCCFSLFSIVSLHLRVSLCQVVCCCVILFLYYIFYRVFMYVYIYVGSLESISFYLFCSNALLPTSGWWHDYII